MANEQATGIMFSETLPDDIDLDKIESYDDMDEGDFMDWLNTPGRYLMKCLNVKTQDDGKHKPSENILFKITGGENADEVGKVHIERLYHSAADRAVKIGKRMGVWSAEQHQQMLETVRAGEPANGPDFTPCIGKEFVVVIKSEEHNGKTLCKMDYVGIWQVADPRVADFVARVRGGGSPTPAATKATQGKAEPAKATPASNGKTTTKAKTTTAKPAMAAAGVDEL